MGMFDRVKVECPYCGEETEFQSKAGDCILATYTLADAPVEVLLDLKKNGAKQCGNCGEWIEVNVFASITKPYSKEWIL